MPTIATAKHWATQKLQQAGFETAVLDARVLLARALKQPVSWLYSYPEAQLEHETWQRVQDLVTRRLQHMPVARIVGEREFWGMSFKVTTATLDPRADSETIVSAALHHWPRATGGRVLDLGTGTGCLLLSILQERPGTLGLGIDQSAEAVEVARHNMLALGLQDRCHIQKADWENANDIKMLQECMPFDVIVSNPPYIPSMVVDRLSPEVRLYDPRDALDGGIDGLRAYRVISRLVPTVLSAQGTLVLEIGEGQAQQVTEIFEACSFEKVATHPDIQGIERALVFRRRSL